MIRLFEIEWLKLKNYKVFWILIAMYFLGLIIVLSSGMFLMQFMKNQGAEFQGIDPTIIPLYDFPDVWQVAAHFQPGCDCVHANACPYLYNQAHFH